MKFSSPANIALASIALSSPNLLSSPVFANAAPTGDSRLPPSLGAGHFGTSPRMHATDSPVMPAMASPPTSKIAGRRHSLRRSRSIKHRRVGGESRNIDPLGLGVRAGEIQPGAESILHSRMTPAGLFSGTQGTLDPFSPVVGQGGLLGNTGLVPPNTPMLGGIPLSNGVDPSALLGAIPAMVPTPGVDNVIPIIQNAVSSAPTVLSPLTSGTLPYLNGLSPILGASPIALPQVPGALAPVLGNLPQLPGGFPSLVAGSPSVPGATSQVLGAPSQLLNALPPVPGVSQTGSLPAPAPDANRLAPSAIVPNLGASPNVAMPPIAGALPQMPGLVPGASQSTGGHSPLANAIPQIPGTVPQVPGILPQIPGGASVVPQVPGAIPQLPADPLSKVNPGLTTPGLAGATPIFAGSEIPLASPVVPVTGLAVPTMSLPVPATSILPFSNVALPTSLSVLNALPTLLSNSNALPTAAKSSLPAQPIESLAPPDPLAASNSIPHILVSGPDAIGIFEPLEGVGAGAMGRPDDDDGAQTESARPEHGNGVGHGESGEFDESGMSDGGKSAQNTSGTESAVESRTTSWSTTQSERAGADRTIGELVPTSLVRLSAKLDVPTITKFPAPKPTANDAQITSSPEPTPKVNEEIPPVWKRWESKSSSLSSDIGSRVTDQSGSPLLSEGVPVPMSSVYVPPVARLSVPSHETPSVSRSASMVTLKSFSMASITESPAPVPVPAQTAPPVIGGIGSTLIMAQPTGLVPTFSDDSLSSHSSLDERPLLVSPSAPAVASSPVPSLYTGGVPLSRTFERSADTPSSTVAIRGDSPNMPSPTGLGQGTSMGSQDTATRKIFRWGVPKMVTSTIRSVATAVKK
ncbi:unnamed protein product [Rhizoctonia solani]|uniref:Uncharacterized protein n=1 Tax=Rhizoctonia solani TaxID=456999 RepID=A0A8H3HBJ3_9AGAM|nr:unnamed protein product [Rhizoctonia solani]